MHLNIEIGEIRIVLNKQEDNYILTIKDNGIGLSEDIQPENSRSLGFMLVNALVTQLEGKICFEIENGTLFIITFKELEYQNRI
ncbi:MAG: ATP-binding protein [Methanobacterium sp.]|nr:ATP-binding protein [Methanobacterium sp.]